jgi:hypothetical protein
LEGVSMAPNLIGHTGQPWLLDFLESRALFAGGAWDVALIDSTLPDRAALVRAMVPGGHVILFDGRHDTAADVLARTIQWAQRSGASIGSLSLLSHASAGRFALGTDWISNSTLKATAEDWRRLGGVMTRGAAINLFGCNLVDPGGDGQALIDGIARLTGACVFGSTDLTGHDGDWVLEAVSHVRGTRRGTIARAERRPDYPFSLARLSQWDGNLTSAAGAETLVNTTTAGTQRTHFESPQAVASDDAGNYLVVWSSLNQDGSGWGVYGQRYNAAGIAQGAEFRVNVTTSNDQLQPAVAMDANGDFVVAWSGEGAGDTGGIFARRYNAAGVAQGAELRVNTTTTGVQQYPSVAMSDAGAFVITWTSANQDGDAGGVYAQRYSAAGVAQGGEFRVNVATAFDQAFSRVSMASNGDFVVAFASVVQTSTGYGVLARRFAANGTALSGEFVVNTNFADNQQFPAIAVAPSGAFVVAWQSNLQDGSGQGIYARRYDSAGTALSGEFLVNTTTANDQRHPAIAMDSAGYFVITWESVAQDGAGVGVYAREYTITGVAQGGEFRINTTTAADQQFPSIALDAAGDFVVVWSGNGSGDADGVFAQRYDGGAGIVVTPTSGLVTTESGGTATFTIVLNTAPTANVTVALSSSDTTEGTASVSSLTFTPANWTTPQSVTVTGVNDSLIDGDINYSIVTAAATSADSRYDGQNASDVSVINTDNDAPGFAISPLSGLFTTEGGGTATFTVVLTAQPTADVTLGLSSDDPAEGVPSVPSLTFTSANWNVPQTVTLTGADDLVADGNRLYTIVTAAATSADANFDGVNPADVAVTNLDDDTAAIFVTPTTGLTTSEAGAAATFQVVLNSQPTANVVIDLSSGDPSEGTLSVGTLTFTPANWTIPQTVTITGVDDALDDGDVGYTIATAAAVSSDGAYDGLDPADVSVTNTDDDGVGILVTPTSGLVTTEAGGAASFTIALTSQPTADVFIALGSSDTTEGTLSISGVTLTPANWNTPQTVWVTGADDFLDEGDIAYTIVTAAATSADATYHGLNTADVSLANTDDDTAGVTITPTSGLTTTETGGSATFSVVLDSQPTADVTIVPSSSNPTEGDVSPTSITFTPANWNIVRVVTVTGVDDNVADGDVAYSIITSAATSTDPGYNGLAVADVSLTNLDDENQPPAIVPSTGTLNYTEDDGPRTIDPLLTASDRAGAMWHSATITFTAGYAPGQDLLAASPAGPITAVWDAGSGTLTLAGAATLAQYQAALRSITYANPSQAPQTHSRTIELVVNDGIDSSVPVTWQIMVASVNDAPVGAADEYVATAGVPLVVGHSDGVLGNDSDVEGDSLTTTLITGPAMGQLVLNGDGSFTYTPAAGAGGIDEFTYRVSDGAASSDIVRVRLTVQGDSTPQPPPPPPPPIDDTGPDPIVPDDSEDDSDEETPPVDEPIVPAPPPPAPHPIVPVPDLPEPTPPPAPAPAPAPAQVEVPPSHPDLTPLPVPIAPVQVNPPVVVAPAPMIEPPTFTGSVTPPLPAGSGRLSQDDVAEISQRLDSLSNQLEDERRQGAVILTVGKAAAAVWVGYVIYALRAGSLLTSLLSVMPMWRTLDPLPIIQAAEAKMHRLKRRLESGKGKGTSDTPDEEELSSVIG